MLRLKIGTSPGWTEAALGDLGSVLIDHVHCEKKAAVTAISLINRYPRRSLLVARMASLAEEELSHFTRVLKHAEALGFSLDRDKSDEYVNRLLEAVRKQEPHRMLDSLLCAALIEARSCERFKLLHEVLPDGETREMYGELFKSEAGHYTLFTNLARTYFLPDAVSARLNELADHEKEIVCSLPNLPRIHG